MIITTSNTISFALTIQRYYVECLPGDILFLVSDGVHDNYDPEHLGKMPDAFDLVAKTWGEAEKDSAEKVEEIKTLFRQRLLLDQINDNILPKMVLYLDNLRSFEGTICNAKPCKG
jgi:hypothetical protein